MGLNVPFGTMVSIGLKPDRVNLDDNFIRLRHWPRDISERDVVAFAIASKDERFHFYLFPGWWLICGRAKNSSALGTKSAWNWNTAP